jgi:hypothetical protein
VVYVVIAAFVSHPVRRIGAEHAATESAQTGNLADAIANVMAVKSFARERYERQRFAQSPSAPGTRCCGCPARTCGRWPGLAG